jgi:uncharacterized protein (DUF934 family)
LAAPATAHVFQSGTWEGALEGAVDLNRLEAKRKGFPLATFENLRSEERLTRRNVGVYISPGTEMADLVAYIIAVQHE